MIRTQIQLTGEQSEALKQMSAREGNTIAELVRQGVDQLIRSKGWVGQEELRRSRMPPSNPLKSRNSPLLY